MNYLSEFVYLKKKTENMGMISRVRGRIRSDSFSKIQTLKSDDKIANIGEYALFYISKHLIVDQSTSPWFQVPIRKISP